MENDVLVGTASIFSIAKDNLIIRNYAINTSTNTIKNSKSQRPQISMNLSLKKKNLNYDKSTIKLTSSWVYKKLTSQSYDIIYSLLENNIS